MSIQNLFPDQDYDSLWRGLREGELFEDKHFDKTLDNIKGIENNRHQGVDIKWQRPHEIAKNLPIPYLPSFVAWGASIFDVNQGVLGDCWFLANLSNLAENKTWYAKVVPQNQSFDEGIYKGIFRFRFYRWNLTASDLYRHVIVFFTGSINGWRL